MTMSATEILIVDDNEVWLRTLRRSLRSRSDWNLTYASSSSEALSLLVLRHFDVVVSDFHMPGPNGLAVLHAAPNSIRILATASEVELDLTDADLLLAKPFYPEFLQESIDGLMASRALTGRSLPADTCAR
jgi:CheY-like chemotaxis protein